MKKSCLKFLLLFILVIFSFVTSCASRTIPATSPDIAETLGKSQVSQNASKDSWQVSWESAIKEGKREGKVVMYSAQTSNEMRQAMAKTMNDKFGIQLDVVVGRGEELRSKVYRERSANLFLVDMYLGGGAIDFKPYGFLEPLEPALILPEVIDPKLWLGGKLNWIDKEHHAIGFFGPLNAPIAINTSMVKPQEITSYYDLLNPKWKGKIVMNDTTTSGTGFSSFRAVGWKILNLDFFYQLVKQEPVIVRDRRLLVEWAARGKYPICLFPNTSIVREFKNAGSPLALLTPKEGTYLSSGGGHISIFKNAPNPNARKVLINWLLSREGQTIVSNAKGAQSLRIDVKTEGLDPTEVRQEGMKYFIEEELDPIEKEERRKIAEEIFSSFVIIK